MKSTASKTNAPPALAEVIPGFMSTAQVMHAVCVTRQTLRTWRANGVFPQPYKASQSLGLYMTSDIAAFLAKQAAAQ